MNLKDWIGRVETTSDVIHPTPCAALAAMLDRPPARPADGAVLPPLWHWLYFLPLHRQSEIGPDGHALRGGFLPPVPLPRRVWAGSRFRFHRPLRVGDRVTRVSTIEDVTEKHGRTGKLVFVRVRHEIRRNDEDGPALTEFHDIGYREKPGPNDISPPPQPAPASASFQRRIVPDDVLLFRYSALTFNGHRIHYDRRYVTEAEGYPGLVVHGPLIATLLLDLFRQALPTAEVVTFDFKVIRPLFDIHAFFICGAMDADGKTCRLWATDHERWLAVDGRVVIAQAA